MARRLLVIGILCLLMCAAIFAWNYASIQRLTSTAISEDSRNSGIEVFAHYEWFLNSNVLIFDLRKVSGSNSEADVSRVLLQCAESLKSEQFEKVILSYRGEPKFMLKGDYFNTLGTEYGIENPVYVLRTFPGNVYNLDGTQAFDTWTGGLLGVVGKQMEDLNEFSRRWYLTDLTNGG